MTRTRRTLTKRPTRTDMDSDLFGPDVSDAPVEPIKVVGDTVNVWSAQFLNRWVFLPHQRVAALKELKELINQEPPQAQGLGIGD